MTDKLIFNFVEGQWQLSDLQEISNENGCLPKNLVQQVHIVLTGTYILQVSFDILVVFLTNKTNIGELLLCLRR